MSSYFNTMEAVENGDSYIFIKKNMGKYVWYITGFWTWYDITDKGIVFIKAYPKPVYPKKRKKVQQQVERKPLPKPKTLTFDPNPQPPPVLQAWSSQERYDTREAFWDFVDEMERNCLEMRIESRIYLEARKVLRVGQH